MRVTKGIGAAVGSSLKLKLILLLVSILAFTVGIAAWSAIKMQERQLLRSSQERLLALHEMLAKTVVATCMMTGDRESVQKVFETVRFHQDLERVRIFDTDGLIKYSSEPRERGEHITPGELARFLDQQGQVIFTQANNRAAYTLVQPMLNQVPCVSCHSPEQKVLGVLQVSLSLESPRQHLVELTRSAQMATLIALGVIVIGLWLALTFLVDHPLQHLVEVMARAGHGDLGARADERRDEFGQVARHFNDMISKLGVAQEEIERYHQEQLARADRLASLGEMAAAIAHEIRNPLTGISGALSVLGRDFQPDDPRREILRQTRSLIERLNKSVEDILVYSRPLEPRFEAVDLDDIVDRSLSLVEGEAKKAQLQLTREPALRIDGQPGLPFVVADSHQLRQVLTNLILNAIQATAAGGRICIRTRLADNHREQRYACIEIQDTGKGMTPEETAQAFKPFFSTKAQGTGLGLPIAKRIIEQHQGRISLRSTPGEGTCVQVELPLQPDSETRSASA
jgi:two-component system NtrC family sensor kinase